jgi:hypothetical protein
MSISIFDASKQHFPTPDQFKDHHVIMMNPARFLLV